MKAVVLIGHGGVPTDYPSEKVGRLKALEAARQKANLPMSAEEKILDDEIRAWPRTMENEPFFFGLQAIADEVSKKIAPLHLQLAFNEFCGPSIEAACAELIAAGYTELILLSTMITRGGIHSEFEIPQIVEELKKEYPQVTFNYRWPLNLENIGSFFAAQL